MKMLGFVTIMLSLSQAIAMVPQGSTLSTTQELSCLAPKMAEIEPSRTGQDAPTTLLMAFMSSLAYEDAGTMERLGANAGFTQVIPLEKMVRSFKIDWKKSWYQQKMIWAHTRGVWAENDRFIVVAFTGSDFSDIANLATNGLSTRTAMGQLGRVHSGFYGATKIIWKALMTEFKKVKTAKPIYLTGHSLGAALSTIAAVKLLDHEYQASIQAKKKGPAATVNWNAPYVAGLYTFGSPQPGDRKFQLVANTLFRTKMAIRVNGEIPPPAHSARFVNEDDMVVSIPGKHEFRHIYLCYRFETSGELTLLSAKDQLEASKPLHTLTHQFKEIFKRDLSKIEVHRVLNYLRKSHRAYAGEYSSCGPTPVTMALKEKSN